MNSEDLTVLCLNRAGVRSMICYTPAQQALSPVFFFFFFFLPLSISYSYVTQADLELTTHTVHTDLRFAILLPLPSSFGMK